jgi:alcohol dehydrogenase
VTNTESASATWSYPTEIRFGAGRIRELIDACHHAGISRPLVVTDPGLAELPVIGTIRELFDRAGMSHTLFSDLRPNPVGRDVHAGVAAFRDGDHDGVVAVGGGSALDIGKIVAFMTGQTRPMWDFEDIGDNWTRAEADTVPPVVAVPTTAGTGSEVGRAGVVINEDSHRKVIVFHPSMLPTVVISDPELTVGLPRVLTVGTGLDALSHSLEAICAPGLHPMSHGIGLEGCRLVMTHLPRAVADPGNLESRGQMLIAAAMGAVAFQKGLGGMHALSHPIGVRFHTHHGMTNAIVMPYVLVANRPAIEPTIDRLAAYLDLPGGFDGFVGEILAMRTTMDVPHTLVDLGVDTAAIEEIAADAVLDPSAAGNPLPFDRALAEAILVAACSGDLTLQET